MSRDEVQKVVLGALAAIAPEADLEQLDPSEDVREALDLDSMDILRFATALHERLGVDVPEADYARIASVNGCLDYLGERASLPPGR